MNIYLDPSEIIKKAASRARGDRLTELVYICETQKTISTRRLLMYVEKLQKSDTQDAFHFKKLADFILNQTKATHD